MDLYYIDRETGHKKQEHVYGERFLKLLYGRTISNRLLGNQLTFLVARIPFFSALYGYLQRLPISAKKIQPFIDKFQIKTSEFAKKPETFKNFNQFFTRKLKPETRPIDPHPNKAIIPADGRYLFYQNIAQADGFIVKGKKFDLNKLLQNAELAKEYAEGAMLIARLCPTDYHRYHFPFDCIPGNTKTINGWLYSVNPIAIKKNIKIFTENKRSICVLTSETFGKVLFIEIGATFVGAIHQTYTPFQNYKKGDEKGYFSFGASSLIIIFSPDTIQFDQDLLNASAEHIEIRCQMGQSMATLIS